VGLCTNESRLKIGNGIYRALAAKAILLICLPGKD
jgi:hypothetical protein